MQEQMEQVKKEKIDALNQEFEDKKRKLMESQKERQTPSARKSVPMQQIPFGPNTSSGVKGTRYSH
jgi:hypothetical protein